MDYIIDKRISFIDTIFLFINFFRDYYCHYVF
jgi:hypothetical protein